MKKLQEKLAETLEQYPFNEAARYALFSGGKRIRPRLYLKTLEMFGHPPVWEPAIALEFIHTYSLIHDDLPAMDNDDFRRGKPTVHKVFPEGIAILAGDFLLTAAFEVLAQTPCDDTKKIALIQVLSRAAGMHGMIGGQIMDLSKSDNLIEMHRLKTGALMGAALEMASIVLEKERAPFKELGEKIGILFQIQNDLNDDRGSDAKNEKKTFANRADVEQQIASLKSALSGKFSGFSALLEEVPEVAG